MRSKYTKIFNLCLQVRIKSYLILIPAVQVIKPVDYSHLKMKS